ncbi:MAG: type II toxin-antitoxin system death-on-curing family toxin [Thermoplasmataceae archaeon]
MKSAAILESIIRLHPFIDGNKRTALMVVIEFLKINGYTIILPLSSVRLTISIAKNTKQEALSIEKLIKRSAKWINKYAFETHEVDRTKIKKSLFELFLLKALIKLKLKIIASLLLLKWFVYDIYHRDVKEMLNAMSLLNFSVRLAMKNIGENIDDYM